GCGTDLSPYRPRGLRPRPRDQGDGRQTPTGATGLDLRLARVTDALMLAPRWGADGRCFTLKSARSRSIKPAAGMLVLVFLLGIRGRRRWRRRSRGRRSVLAFVAPPGFVGEPGLGARRDEVVAIRKLRHHRAGCTGVGLRHQALQFRGTDSEVFALGLQLLAVIQIVFGWIDEGAGGNAVSQTCTAGKPDAANEQHHRSGGAQPWPQRTNKSDHAAFINGQH